MRVPGAEIVAAEGPNRLAGLVSPAQPDAAGALLRADAVRFVSCLWWKVGAGWSIRERTLGDDLVFVPIRGEIALSARGQVETLAPGQIAIVPEGMPHAARHRPGSRAFEVIAVHAVVRSAWGTPLLHGLRRCVETLPDPARWQRDLAECCALHATHPALGERWGAALVARLLAELVMSRMRLELPPPGGDERVAAAIAAVAEAAGPVPGVAELARRVGLGETRFRARFAQAVGCQPKAWIDRERMRRAERLLRAGDDAVARIAREAGFGSLRQFLDRFRAAHGCTPTQWRRRVASP